MAGTGAAAAAQGTRVIDIKGRKIELGKLTYKDLASIREQACAECKRSLIKTYVDNLDLLDEQERATARRDAFEEAAKLTADSLPSKKAWVEKRDKDGRILRHRGERFFHKEASVWVEDGGPLLEEQDIEYSGWWMSQTNAGRLYAAWLSIRKCPGQEAMTLDDILLLLTDDNEIEEIADQVGSLSQQRLGNDQPPQEAKPAGAAL